MVHAHEYTMKARKHGAFDVVAKPAFLTRYGLFMLMVKFINRENYPCICFLRDIFSIARICLQLRASPSCSFLFFQNIAAPLKVHHLPLNFHYTHSHIHTCTLHFVSFSCISTNISFASSAAFIS